MRIALETHNETLRKAVEVHAGHVFKYTGDGMCAVFDSPRSAVDAAVAGVQEGAQDVRGLLAPSIVAAIIHDIRGKSRPWGSS